MAVKMKAIWLCLNRMPAVLLVITLAFWSVGCGESSDRSEETAKPASQTGPILRIGLTPERDIYDQRERYHALSHYLSKQLNRPVEFVILSTYANILKDFEEEKIHGAFLGSLVAVLAMDRMGAKPVVVPERSAGCSSYHGVLFVRDDSSIKCLDDLSEKKRTMAMVRTTTAGHIFPLCTIMKLKLWGESAQPDILWMGTHDDVVSAVINGRADIGAVKNLRLDVLVENNSKWKIRQLAISKCVPNNALILRSDVYEQLAPLMLRAMQGMTDDTEGRQALESLKISKFIPCNHIDFFSVYEMIDCVLPEWKRVGIPGKPPVPPASWPKMIPREQRRCYEENS